MPDNQTVNPTAQEARTTLVSARERWLARYMADPRYAEFLLTILGGTWNSVCERLHMAPVTVVTVRVDCSQAPSAAHWRAIAASPARCAGRVHAATWLLRWNASLAIGPKASCPA